MPFTSRAISVCFFIFSVLDSYSSIHYSRRPSCWCIFRLYVVLFIITFVYFTSIFYFSSFFFHSFLCAVVIDKIYCMAFRMNGIYAIRLTFVENKERKQKNKFHRTHTRAHENSFNIQYETLKWYRVWSHARRHFRFTMKEEGEKNVKNQYILFEIYLPQLAPTTLTVTNS